MPDRAGRSSRGCSRRNKRRYPRARCGAAAAVSPSSSPRTGTYVGTRCRTVTCARTRKATARESSSTPCRRSCCHRIRPNAPDVGGCARNRLSRECPGWTAAADAQVAVAGFLVNDHCAACAPPREDDDGHLAGRAIRPRRASRRPLRLRVLPRHQGLTVPDTIRARCPCAQGTPRQTPGPPQPSQGVLVASEPRPDPAGAPGVERCTDPERPRWVGSGRSCCRTSCRRCR